MQLLVPEYRRVARLRHAMQISLGQMADRESSARINDAAALWVARLDAGTLSPEEEVELDAWLAADFPLEPAVLASLADQAVARLTRDPKS